MVASSVSRSAANSRYGTPPRWVTAASDSAPPSTDSLNTASSALASCGDALAYTRLADGTSSIAYVVTPTLLSPGRRITPTILHGGGIALPPGSAIPPPWTPQRGDSVLSATRTD